MTFELGSVFGCMETSLDLSDFLEKPSLHKANGPGLSSVSP